MSNTSDLLAQAEKHLAQNELNEAATLFEQVHQQDSSSADGAFGMARVALRLGQIADARQILEKILAKFPAHSEAQGLNNTAESLAQAEQHLAQNELNEAATLFDKVHQQDSTSAEGAFGMARVAARLGQGSDARHILEKILLKFPKHEGAAALSQTVDALAQAEQHLAQGELDQAAVLFEQVHQQNPGAADGAYGIARIAVKLGQDDDAAQILEKILTKFPDFAGAQELRKSVAKTS